MISNKIWNTFCIQIPYERINAGEVIVDKAGGRKDNIAGLKQADL